MKNICFFLTFNINLITVLSSVKQFLPLMKDANKELDTIPADDLDIECISNENDHVIEMVRIHFAFFK